MNKYINPIIDKRERNICTMSTIDHILIKIATEVVTSENIMDYLNVIRNNMNMSVLNQAMVYFQNPEAQIVCGRASWRNIDRVVTNQAPAIILFFPLIEMTVIKEKTAPDGSKQTETVVDKPLYKEGMNATYANDFKAVDAYDLSSTQGSTTHICRIVNYDVIMDRILTITQATCEYVDIQTTDLPVMGYYDKDSNCFYFSNSLSMLDNKYCTREKETKKAAVYMYLDYFFNMTHTDDEALHEAIMYIISKYYCFDYEISQNAFASLDARSEKEKIIFLTLLQFYTSNIIQDIDGYVFNFDEIAMLNDLMYTKDTDKVLKLFDQILPDVDNSVLADTIIGLKTKLMHLDKDQLEQIYKRIKGGSLYSYPPYEITLDDDYMRNERKKLYEKINHTAAEYAEQVMRAEHS